MEITTKDEVVSHKLRLSLKAKIITAPKEELGVGDEELSVVRVRGEG